MAISGHETKMAVRRRLAKEHAACKFHGSMFHRTGIIADESFTLLEYGVLTFLLL